ncbi:MAG: PEP-CTERM sorting domain-containing protein [Phycisphaerae bacterium]
MNSQRCIDIERVMPASHLPRKRQNAWGWVAVAVAACFCMTANARAQEAQRLVGIDYDSGDVYEISTSDASLSMVGSTGLSQVGAFELTSAGLLAFTTSGDGQPTLYNLNPVTFEPMSIGPLSQQIIFDGSIVEAGDGTLYGTNRGSVAAAQLFELDPDTGATSLVGFISVDGDTRHDVNGMAYRGDGMLIGLDRVSQSLLEINTATAEATVLTNLTPDLGSVGGMAVLDGVGYFVTAGPDATVPGSNELYRFDLFTGQYESLGNFNGTISGTGLSGLAVVPEPTTALLLMAAVPAMLNRRRKRASSVS